MWIFLVFELMCIYTQPCPEEKSTKIFCWTALAWDGKDAGVPVHVSWTLTQILTIVFLYVLNSLIFHFTAKANDLSFSLVVCPRRFFSVTPCSLWPKHSGWCRHLGVWVFASVYSCSCVRGYHSCNLAPKSKKMRQYSWVFLFVSDFSWQSDR